MTIPWGVLVRTGATVEFGDDFAPGKTGVGLRATDGEPAGGVDEDLEGSGAKAVGDHRLDDVPADLFSQRGRVDVLGVLGRKHDPLHPDRCPIDVTHRDLLLTSGRGQGQSSERRSAACRRIRAWAMLGVGGINSGVSSQA